MEKISLLTPRSLSLLFLLLIYGGAFYYGKLAAVTSVLLFFLLALHEYSRIAFKESSPAFEKLFLISGGALLIGYAFDYLPFIVILPTAGLLSAAALLLLRHKQEEQIMKTVLLGFFGLIYVVAFPATSLEIIKADRFFFLWVGFVILIADTGAYLVGSMWGKRPLIRISPNKSWEGVWGSLSGAVLGGYLFWFLLRDIFESVEMSLLQVGCLSVSLSILAIFGDLLESLFKRYFSLKDSSNLIPGHGGALDRLDSFYFLGPWLLIYLNFLH